jgi:hypothetical protein
LRPRLSERATGEGKTQACLVDNPVRSQKKALGLVAVNRGCCRRGAIGVCCGSVSRAVGRGGPLLTAVDPP